MKYKQNFQWIPLTGIIISGTFLFALLLIAISLGNSWICDSMSIFGKQPTCVEAISTSWFGLMTIGALVLFIIWLVTIKISIFTNNKRK